MEVNNIPESLKFFAQAVLHPGDCGRSLNDKPEWLQMEKIRRGQRFAKEYITSIFYANFTSLFALYVSNDDLNILIFSGRSKTPFSAFKRYVSTLIRMKNWLTEDIWTEGTQAYKDLQTVRRMHLTIQTKLRKCDNNTFDLATKISNPWSSKLQTILQDFSSSLNAIEKNTYLSSLSKPTELNQAKMASAQFAFMGLVVLYPREFSIVAGAKDLEAFCHLWRYIGYRLGIKDEYNFCRGNLVEIKQRTHDFLEIFVKEYLREVTAEWEHMLRCIVEGMIYVSPIYNSFMSFEVFLLSLTDLLNIDMTLFRSTLTFYQRLQLLFKNFLFRYIISIPFLRRLVNWIMFHTLIKATKFSPRKLKILQEKSANIVPDLS